MQCNTKRQITFIINIAIPKLKVFSLTNRNIFTNILYATIKKILHRFKYYSKKAMHYETTIQLFSCSHNSLLIHVKIYLQLEGDTKDCISSLSATQEVSCCIRKGHYIYKHACIHDKCICTHYVSSLNFVHIILCQFNDPILCFTINNNEWPCNNLLSVCFQIRHHCCSCIAVLEVRPMLHYINE